MLKGKTIVTINKRSMSSFFLKMPFLKKEIKKEKTDSADILNVLSDTSISIGDIQNKVERIEAVYSIQQRTLRRTNNKLVYILNNIGLNNINSKYEFVNDLTNMSLKSITLLINKKVYDRDEYLTIMAHLIFRNLLSIDLFMKIIMKLPIQDVINIHNSLFEDPGEILHMWERDKRTRLMAGISIASRYKMLGEYHRSREIISSVVLSDWIPSIKCGNILNCIDGRNLLGLLDHMIEYNVLLELVMSTENRDFMYSFWEMHPRDTILKERLQENSQMKNIKGFFINMMQCSIIATNNEYVDKMLNISKKTHLSNLKDDEINECKLIILIEQVINEIKDNIVLKNAEEIDSFNELQVLFEEFKRVRKLDEHDEIEMINAIHEIVN